MCLNFEELDAPNPGVICCNSLQFAIILYRSPRVPAYKSNIKAFASDSARVMVGEENSVAVELKAAAPESVILQENKEEQAKNWSGYDDKTEAAVLRISQVLMQESIDQHDQDAGKM